MPESDKILCLSRFFHHFFNVAENIVRIYELRKLEKSAQTLARSRAFAVVFW
jgi:hypothetical protein